MADLRAGQIVGERYRIDAVLGAGGMGVVVAATHVELGQRVAIKFLMDVHPRAVSRFQREGRVLVRLKSPHVARVLDVGLLEEDETPYLVMEHLEGQDLADVLEAVGRLPYAEVVDYVIQACDAIAEAHSHAVVHRDLKPANIFLATGRGGARTVKVLDFGISKRLHTDEAPTSSELTSEGVAMGSVGYMAPEQISNARDVDSRADVYSLGALMYALMTGAPPYKGDSPFAILAEMGKSPVPPLRSIVPEVPQALAAAVERCLVQAPEERFPTVAHLVQSLAPFATPRGRNYIKQISGTLGVELPQSEEIADTVALPPPHAPSRHPSLPPWEPARVPAPAPATSETVARRRTSLAVAIAGVVGVIAAIFAGTAWRAFQARRPPPDTAASAQPAQVTRGEPEVAPAVTVPAVAAAEPTEPPPNAAVPGETSAHARAAVPPPAERAPRPGRPRPPIGPRVAPSSASDPPNAATMPASRR